jgi:hypothetical protein
MGAAIGSFAFFWQMQKDIAGEWTTPDEITESTTYYL